MPPKQTNWVTFSDDEGLTDLSSDEEDDDPPLIPARNPLPPIHTHTVTQPEPSASPSPTPTHAPVRSKSTRPSTQSATQKSRERGGLKSFATTLRPGRNVNFAISSLHAWLLDESLDLNAEYQRGIVWKDEKQSGLIDSLFHNFHIPPLVFVVTRQIDGGETRVCVDGKQRLTSIQRFILGEIPYKDPTTASKLYFTSPSGTRRKTISQAMQQTFMNKQIACYEYEDVTPEQEREIFQARLYLRVQMGVALGPAERLAAINGPYADLVRTMRRRIISKPGLETFLDWGSSNGRNFQALAQILYLIVHGTSPSKAEPNYKRLSTFLSQPNPGGNTLSQLEKTTMKTVDVFCAIRLDPELGAPLLEDLSVLEFVMAAYLVYTYHAKYTLAQLSDAIEQMRVNLKKECSDRKFVPKNFKHVLGFVLRQVSKLTLRTAAGEVAGQVVANSRKLKHSRSETPGVPAASSSTQATKVVRKRKRDEAEMDVDEEKDNDEDEDGYIIPVKKKSTTQARQKQKKEAPLTPAPDPPPAVAKSKLAAGNRSASTSKAKTTVKKSPKKGEAGSSTTTKSTTTARKASLPTILRSINDQVAKPSSSSTTRPAAPVRTSSSTFEAAPTPPPSSGTPAPPPSAPPLASGSVSAGTQARRPLPGRTRTTTSASASTTPVVPQPSQPFIGGPSISGESALFDSFPTANVNSISPPARAGSTFGRDRLAPLRDAKAAAAKSASSPSLGGSASVAYLNACVNGNGNGGSLSRPSSSSGAGTGTSKFPKFNRIQPQSPVEDGASGSAGFASASASTSTQLDASLSRRPSLQVMPSGAGTMVSAQVLVPHSAAGASSGGGVWALATPANTPSPVMLESALAMKSQPQIQIPSAAAWSGGLPQGQGQVLYQVPPQVQAAQAQAYAQQVQAQAAAFTATKDPRSAWRGVNGN